MRVLRFIKRLATGAGGAARCACGRARLLGGAARCARPLGSAARCARPLGCACGVRVRLLGCAARCAWPLGCACGRALSLAGVLTLGLTFGLATGCVRNDIDYPEVVPTVAAVVCPEAERVVIDGSGRSVTLELAETADICAVHLERLELGEEVSSLRENICGTLDLSQERPFTLCAYGREYRWTLKATQEIDCRFSVSGQSGKTVIDRVNRRIIVTVPKTEALSWLKVSSCRLGPEGLTTYAPDPLQLRDFSEPVHIDVTCHGRTETWTVFVEKTDILVSFTEVSPWTRVVWLRANGIAGQKQGFRIRKVGEQQWTEVPDSCIGGGSASGESFGSGVGSGGPGFDGSVGVGGGSAVGGGGFGGSGGFDGGSASGGGSFSACVEGLEPLCRYECIAYSGEAVSAIESFTTEAERQLPNSGMEVYSHHESPGYFSFYDPAYSGSYADCTEKWWDSGNSGSTMVGATGIICSPDTDCFAQGACSCRMNSRYVVVKFAAGNIFSGSFAGLVGMSGGKVNFGRPWTLRPRKLSLMVKYDCGEIDVVGSLPDSGRRTGVQKGDKDECQIFIALGDWDYRSFGGTPQSPVQVNTTDKSTFFNSSSDAVIAYGEFVSSSTLGWTRIEIPLTYTSTSRIPTHIIISCAASDLGDYFTGSSTSTLWVDDFRLEY